MTTRGRQAGVLQARWLRCTFPSFITKETARSAVISASGSRSTASLKRHPGESRDPSLSIAMVAKWIPAFAGMTKGLAGVLQVPRWRAPHDDEGRPARRRASALLVTVHLAVLHHEEHLAQRCYVGERVAVDGDD